MANTELANELQELTNDELDARYAEMKASGKVAGSECMANGGYNDTVHHHSKDEDIRDACIASLNASNIVFWEYKRRGVKSPAERAREERIDQMFA